MTMSHILIVVSAVLVYVSGCTVIAVGRNATSDGSTLIAHTDDAGDGASDLRLVRVPAMSHAAGAMRAVYRYVGGFPRLVTHDRGELYRPHATHMSVMTPLGYIPQVPHTYGYFDQDYGMMNDVQLAIGESACGAKTAGWPLTAGQYGRNLFGIAELTRVALERCDSARCAIQTMGDLAVEHGFYSEDSGSFLQPEFEDSAEALAVADKYGEVWVFHVLTAHQTDGRLGVWAAQRVSDGHLTAITNGFTIRELRLDQPDWYMASPNVVSFAIECGWWNPSDGTPFDFTAAYGYVDIDASGPLYVGRRLWRIFDVLAPSLRLDARLGSFAQYTTYPFSIKPDQVVSIQQIMDLLRDQYAGTPYDMTNGLGAGPFHAPVRWGGSTGDIQGGWERPISMYRTLFSFVLQSRQHTTPDDVAGVVWYGQSAPHGTVYVPFSCAQEHVPASYLLGTQSEFRLDSAWWAFNFVNNWSLLRYDAIHADVRTQITRLQADSFTMWRHTEAHACGLVDRKARLHQMEQARNAFATHVVTQWWELAWHVVAKYSDGYITTGEQPHDMQMPGYPSWWLHQSEFSTWPGTSFTPKHATTSVYYTIAASMLSLQSVVLVVLVVRALLRKHRRVGYTMLATIQVLSGIM